MIIGAAYINGMLSAIGFPDQERSFRDAQGCDRIDLPVDVGIYRIYWRGFCYPLFRGFGWVGGIVIVVRTPSRSFLPAARSDYYHCRLSVELLYRRLVCWSPVEIPSHLSAAG